MKILHMIGNAHLDPVWLWPRRDGVDAALATARSACDRLDEYDSFVFTCSGRWFHETVETLDPDLFRRVRAFVEAGRWQLVGGMVIQPDCNLPSAESFARQLRSGQEYYRRAFGRTTTIGYNVDSFGHTAYLPRFLREAGIDSYVFLRPGPHEKNLPADLFRWRSPDGSEVTAFRICRAYCTRTADLADHVQATLAAWPDGVEHTMCFFGVGDHGGGPTRAQIEWILEHRELEGVRLVFSHPRAFFDAVAPTADRLPVVAEELQHHAIGCYSVERRIKLAMRGAENRLLQAERVQAALPEAAEESDLQTLRQAWDTLLFNQFHDILGGTSLHEASTDAAAEMTAAGLAAEGVSVALTRRAFRQHARPGVHRIVVFRPEAEDYHGWVSHSPWVEGERRGLILRDEAGNLVPSQWAERSFLTGLGSLSWTCGVPAGGMRFFTLEEGTASPAAPARHAMWEQCSLVGGQLRVGGISVSLEVCDDPTDTWSHSAGNRFSQDVVGRFSFSAAEDVEEGPVYRVRCAGAEFDRSRAWIYWMGAAGESLLRLRVVVQWMQTRQRLQMRLELPDEIARRVDLVSGGLLPRQTDGREYPLNGGTWVADGGERPLTVLTPDVFSLSAEGRSLRLTLLRSPFIAHHDPDMHLAPGRPATDHGDHVFEICLQSDGDHKALLRAARRVQQLPLIWDLTG